jgi:hypothetical protein
MGGGASSGFKAAAAAATDAELKEACSEFSEKDVDKILKALPGGHCKGDALHLVLCGPVVGTVTDSTANVMLEVDEDVEITCTATPVAGGAPVATTRKMKNGGPGVFQLRGLAPATEYTISFAPMSDAQKQEIEDRGCKIRTMPAAGDLKKLRVVALSCDWPDRLGKGDENPWDRLATKTKAGECDVMLHLGDQVYTWANGVTTSAMRVMDLIESNPGMGEALKVKMEERAASKLQEAYRSTWHHSGVATTLSHSSHLMIWSDNDVTNDFTVARKPDGSQEFLPEYLKVAMGVYRMYQRQLWDPGCGDDPKNCFKDQPELQEWHFHKYGPFGIFLIDMRGNRIDGEGHIKDAPILSEAQRKAITDAFATPGLACMLLCAEIPFVGEPVGEIQEKAKKLPFLKDHWPYAADELIWICDRCFEWKTAEKGREVIMIGGDIHVSVDSEIKDKETGASIRHITTSPITNSVVPFWPALEGQINERYSYTHKPLLNMRTFAELELSFEDGIAKASAEIVCIPAK